eukprot:15474381-Alexandrium_andersonii.AAC.1
MAGNVSPLWLCPLEGPVRLSWPAGAELPPDARRRPQVRAALPRTARLETLLAESGWRDAAGAPGVPQTHFVAAAW